MVKESEWEERQGGGLAGRPTYPDRSCSSGCNKIVQWDLSRSVPSKVNEVSVYTGDIQGLVTGGGRLFSCGADGSIRSWQVGKKGELTPVAARDKAHKERVSAILYKSVSPALCGDPAVDSMHMGKPNKHIRHVSLAGALQQFFEIRKKAAQSL